MTCGNCGVCLEEEFEECPNCGENPSEGEV
jgi:RNA polymerase subunit RPABC4/transcription elongation factor Spt4